MLIEGQGYSQEEIEQSNKEFKFEQGENNWIVMKHEDGYDYHIKNFLDKNGEKVVILLDNFSVSSIVISKIEGVTFDSLQQGHIEKNLVNIYDSSILDHNQKNPVDYLASLKDYLNENDFIEVVQHYHEYCGDASGREDLKQYLNEEDED